MWLNSWFSLSPLSPIWLSHVSSCNRYAIICSIVYVTADLCHTGQIERTNSRLRMTGFHAGIARQGHLYDLQMKSVTKIKFPWWIPNSDQINLCFLLGFAALLGNCCLYKAAQRSWEDLFYCVPSQMNPAPKLFPLLLVHYLLRWDWNETKMRCVSWVVTPRGLIHIFLLLFLYLSFLFLLMDSIAWENLLLLRAQHYQRSLNIDRDRAT